MDLLAFILAISADGITDEQVQTALNAYIAEHPEAVTTVTDGSITKAKLDSNLQGTVDDVGVLKSAINGDSEYIVFEKPDAYYVNIGNSVTQLDVNSPYTENATFHGKSTFIACSPGDVFNVNITYTGTGSSKPFAFCNSSGDILERSSNRDYSNEKVVAPANSAYVAFNAKNASDSVRVGYTTFERIDAEIESLDDKTSALEESLGTVSQLEWEYTDKHYISTKTSPKDVSSPYSTSNSYHGKADWRECSPGDVFIVSLKGNTNYVPYVFCDSSGNILVRASNVQYHDERVVAPMGAAYVGFNSDPSDAYGTVQIGEYTVDKLQAEVDEASSKQFDGMAGVAFGTSLTYKALTDNGFLQYLPTLSGITFDNQGIGSATIMSGILNAVKSYSEYSDKDVCLLEGFVNDWSGNNTLGTYTDDTETTVCGCVRSALNFIMAQNAHITLFLILDHYGKNASLDRSSTAVNSAGLTQYQYYEEIAKVAESLSIPVIKQYAGSQISENTPQYLTDYIHCTALGAKQSAYFIWSQMKQYYPNVIS